MLKKKWLLLLVLVLLMPIVALADTTPPKIVEPFVFPYNNKSMYPGQELIIQFGLEEESALKKAVAVFSNVKDPTSTFSTTRVLHNRSEEYCNLYGTIGTNLDLGEYKLTRLYLEDEAGNSHDFIDSVSLTFTLEKSTLPVAKRFSQRMVLSSSNSLTGKIASPRAVVKGQGYQKRYLVASLYDPQQLVAFMNPGMSGEEIETTAENVMAFHLKMINSKAQEIPTTGFNMRLYFPYPQGYSVRSTEKNGVVWSMRYYDKNFKSFIDIPVNADKHGLWVETDRMGNFMLTWTGLPDTGDSTPIALLVGLMIASLGTAVLLLRRRRNA